MAIPQRPPSLFCLAHQPVSLFLRGEGGGGLGALQCKGGAYYGVRYKRSFPSSLRRKKFQGPILGGRVPPSVHPLALRTERLHERGIPSFPSFLIFLFPFFFSGPIFYQGKKEEEEEEEDLCCRVWFVTGPRGEVHRRGRKEEGGVQYIGT